MASRARPVYCELNLRKPEVQRSEPALSLPVQKVRLSDGSPTAIENGKIVLQPRLCTLRSYGSDPSGVIKPKSMDDKEVVSPFFAKLSEYIESSKNSQDFELISGRVAMIVFAATLMEELVTGNSLFGKMDLQGIAEAVGVCLAAVTCAAIFAWFSSARNRVGRIFKIGCNAFIDNLIDQIVDGLFYESDLSDWSDEL